MQRSFANSPAELRFIQHTFPASENLVEPLQEYSFCFPIDLKAGSNKPSHSIST